VRLAVRRALREPQLRARARVLAQWAAGHDGAARAAELVEAFAAGETAGATAEPPRRRPSVRS